MTQRTDTIRDSAVAWRQSFKSDSAEFFGIHDLNLDLHDAIHAFYHLIPGHYLDETTVVSIHHLLTSAWRSLINGYEDFINYHRESLALYLGPIECGDHDHDTYLL